MQGHSKWDYLLVFELVLVELKMLVVQVETPIEKMLLQRKVPQRQSQLNG